MNHRTIIITMIVFFLSGFCPGSHASDRSLTFYQWIRANKLKGAYTYVSQDPAKSIQQARAVGMNTVVVKLGTLPVPISDSSLARLQDWGEAAHAAGIHYLVVIDYRGGNELIEGTRCEVDENGVRWEKTPCPLDAGYWQKWVNGPVLALARLSGKLHLEGVIIDIEMYRAENRSYTSRCYCDDCLKEFFLAHPKNAPENLPPPEERVAWLQTHELLPAYENWFGETLRKLTRKVEQGAHDNNQALALGGLGIDRLDPFTQGIVAGLGKEDFPMLCFTESSYDHGYSPLVADFYRRLKRVQPNFIFVAGLNITSFPAANLAEQCLAASIKTDGYWIWSFEHLTGNFPAFRGYQLREPKQRYWEALRLANKEIDRVAASHGSYKSPLQVREFEPPLPFLTLPGLDKERLADCSVPPRVHLPESEPPQLRRNCPVYLLAKKGLPIEVRIASIDLRPAIPDARYPDTCHYAVLGADGSMPQEDLIPTGQSRLITFTPKKDGIFAVVADAKLNAYKIEVVNSPFGIKASKEMPFITYLDPGRQFFYIPADIENFSVFAKIWAGHHPWHARIMVLDPAGNEVKRVEGELAEWTEIPVTVLPGIPPGLWSVQASSIPNALLIYLSDNISTFLCPNPKLALRTTK